MIIKCENSNTLLIWDVEGIPDVNYEKIALWRSADCFSSNMVSIPILLEKNADDLRRRYLEWIYLLGEAKIDSLKVVDILQLRRDFSYWWMTLRVLKCNYSNSLQISNALKLMAFESWLLGNKFTHVKLVTDNSTLELCIKDWCVKEGLLFQCEILPGRKEKKDKLSWPRRIYKILPWNLQALAWLIGYLVQRWPLKGVGLQEWKKSKGTVAFCSYLYNLVPDAIKLGKYESLYWAHLPDSLNYYECKTNWLHIYLKNTLIPNASKAASLIRQFNANSKGEQIHITLDAFLSFRLVFKVIYDWRIMRSKSLRCQNLNFMRSNALFNLWTLFEEDWLRSINDAEAIRNLLNLNLYEAALKALPLQRVGVYLQENQGWEFALVHVWKAAGHGDLIGSPNASVRFWDLRYFFDYRNYDQNILNNKLPIPDLVALNGSAAMNTYLSSSYPNEKLIEVEALRYLYLSAYNKKFQKKNQLINDSLNVLVLGDYILENTHLQLRLLEQTVTQLRIEAVFVFKPHPNCTLNLADYSGLRMIITTEQLSSLMEKCDVAYTSSLTAAAVDAYCAGIPVISVLDNNKLNMSPLRDCSGVVFVSTPNDLSLALRSINLSSIGKKTFFTLDSSLKLWKKVLLQYF